MYYSEDDLKYLRGEKFSTHYDMRLESNKLVWRVGRIVEICTNANVLHIGCCDHISVIEKKIRENTWLHGLLDEKCAYLQGLDICHEAVEICNKNRYCSVPIIEGDATLCRLEKMEEYDYVLMPEMIEHVNNPVDFLKETKRNLKKQGFKGKYIITAPNALGIMKRNIFTKSCERINTDHKYWFSPFTLAKIMVEAGMAPERCEFVQYSPCEKEEENTYKSDAILVIGY